MCIWRVLSNTVEQMQQTFWFRVLTSFPDSPFGPSSPSLPIDPFNPGVPGKPGLPGKPITP